MLTPITLRCGPSRYLLAMRYLPPLLALLALSCASTAPEAPEYSSCTAEGACARVGATCRDGTWSDATGPGACSHHGGVACWRCR